MSTTKIIIEMNLETGAVRVGHPDSKIHCDYMLAEAKRILDRVDSKRAAGEDAGGRIMVPSGALTVGDNGGSHG